MARQTSEADARKTVEFLERLREDRGALAALRNVWIPAREVKAWPVLARFGAMENRTKQVIAGLYALHPARTPENREDGSMGSVCAKLASKHNTFDLRFRRLLACDRGELAPHLRRVIIAAGAQDVPVDYEGLYRDVQYWGDRIRKRWATDYYRKFQAQEEQDA